MADYPQPLSTDYPVALFPVRLETRFFTGATPELRVRIYPDEIVADFHEPLLSHEEVDAGKAYWTEAFQLGAELDAWRRLRGLFGPQRSAFIVQQTVPTNLPPGWPTLPSGTPLFRTDIPTREGAARAARTTVLPDRWVAIAYREGQEILRRQGEPIDPNLVLAYRPDVAEGSPELVSRDELKIERDLLWTIDFERACAVGMGMKLPLSATDLSLGFDRLLVVGVKTTLSPSAGSAALGGLLDAHHYTRGLALVPQGTPTNNTGEEAAGYPPPDDPQYSYAIERIKVDLDVDLDNHTDGAALARALGVKKSAFAHVEGAKRREQEAARSMNQALWPCTMGYFLEQMMRPLLSAAQINDVRQHFETYVRGRGPLPAFRVGRVPYGILPTTSLQPVAGSSSSTKAASAVTPTPGAAAAPEPSAAMEGRTGVGLLGFTATPEMLLTSTAAPASTAATAGTIETKLPPLLKLWRGLFLDRVPNVARVGATAADPDRDLLGVLSLDASSREVRLREVQGIAYLKNMFRLLGLSVTADDLFRATMVNPVLQAAGIPTLGGGPRVAGLTWADEALRVSRPLVAARTSETAALEDNYIQTIRKASADALRGFGDKGAHEFQNPLLFHLLRQAALLEFARAGVDAAIFKQLAVEHDRVEVELFHISPGTLQRQGHWGRLTNPLTSVTGAQTLGKWLGTVGDNDPNAALRQPVVDHRAALEKLEGLPTAELERLFTETLDTCSHRVDAWITSIAMSRLSKLRDDNPEGVHLGAFAWVEHLRPKPPEVVPPPANAPPPVTKGGYIHAPSMTHAATAAILRSAHLSRTGDARKQVTIDLSSARARRALHLLDAVRQGQPIGAVLGYRLERALHDEKLDKYIAPIRRKYPLGMDPKTNVTDTPPTERLAARDVANGLALRDAIAPFMQDAHPWTTHLVDKLPSIDVADQERVLRCLRLLDGDVDAAADLLMAESIYQAVQGNVDRSSATLATLASGGTLPEPQIVKTPRSGTHYTNRVALVLGVPPTTSAMGWPASTPRGTAEPRLDAWLGRLLGNPGRVRCQISYASPTPTNLTNRVVQVVTLAQLGLGPLDVLALAKRTGSEGTGELDARIRWHARTNLHLTAPVEIDHARSASALDAVTFLEVLEMARLAGDVVSGARPLAPGDFVPPGAADPGGSIDSGELDGRVTAAGSALDAAKVDLFTVIGQTTASPPTASLDPLRAALWRTTVFGIREGVPGSLEGEEATTREALLDQARGVHAELVRRSAAAGAAASGLDRMAAIFGPEQPILPTFVPSNAADLTTAILPLARLGGDRHAPRRWFERAARVRSPLGKLRLAALATEAAGGSKLDLEVAQFPNVGSSPWIGLPIPTGAERPKAGTLSFVQRREFDLASGRWAGLMVDEWSEVIPDEKQTTALAIHHDAPGAEAAQCVLLAVPSVPKSTWTLDGLVAILHETLDLAKVRAVDAELLGPLALLAPCIYIASNLKDDTISLDLSLMRIKDTFVLASESP